MQPVEYSAAELCDLLWELHPDDSELVQKVREWRAVAVSEVPANNRGRYRSNSVQARGVLLRVQPFVAV